jgi:hypothetical protein
VNKNPELQVAKMVAHFDGKDCFPYRAHSMASF